MKTLKRATLAAGLAGALLGATHAAAQDYDRTGWPERFTVGTASEGGTYFAYGNGWAGLVADALGIPGNGRATGGPLQNLILVHTGEFEFAMTTLGPAAEALAGDSPLAPGMTHDRLRAMFAMYQTPFSIAALSQSEIAAISDIPEGAVIGFGPAGSTSDTYFPRMLEMLGTSFEARNGSWTDLADQLRDGRIDLIAFAAGVPVPAVSQLESRAEITIVPFAQDELEQIQATFPVSPFTIPADTYEALNGDQQVVAMWNFAIANADVPDSLVYAVMDVVLGNPEQMTEIHPAATATRPEFWDRNTVIPFHPGAVRWYEDHGIDIPADLQG